MSKRYKLWFSVFAVILSIVAAGIGYGLVGATALSVFKKFVFNFIFMAQFLFTVWVVCMSYRKEK